MELAPDCPVEEVTKWLSSGNTAKLAHFLRRRHATRFFNPIECLRKAADTHAGYGFSMMALCCLLVETVQCYREGMPTSSRKEWGELLNIQIKEPVPADFQLPSAIPKSGMDVFRQFFTDFQNLFPSVDGSAFYCNVRNGLLHQAQTKNGWTIDALGSSICDPTKRHINRNLFAHALSESFDRYIQDLEVKLWSDPEWKRAATKVWWLIRISK